MSEEMKPLESCFYLDIMFPVTGSQLAFHIFICMWEPASALGELRFVCETPGTPHPPPSYLPRACLEAQVVVACLPLNHVWLFVAHQASLTISHSLPKFMFIASVMPSGLLIWPSLLLPSVFPSIRDFSSGLANHIKWPKYWSFSFSISQWVFKVDFL